MTPVPKYPPLHLRRLLQSSVSSAQASSRTRTLEMRLHLLTSGENCRSPPAANPPPPASRSDVESQNDLEGEKPALKCERVRGNAGAGWIRAPFLHPLAHSKQQSSNQSTWAKLGPVQLVHPWKLSGEGSQCRCCELAPVYTSIAHRGSSQMETDGFWFFFFYSPPFDSHPTVRIAPTLTSNPLWQ